MRNKPWVGLLAEALSCAKVDDPVSPSVDENTQRHGMHACPSGSALLGVHLEKHHLLCGRPERMKRSP